MSAAPAPAPGHERARALPDWAVPLLAAAVSLLPHLGAVVPGGTYYFRDFSVTFYPLRLFQARELTAGRWPSWNPFIHEGSFAEPILYPLDLLHVLWPGPAAVSWLLTLHFPIAALAAYVLARDLGARRAGAALGGVVYATGGLAVSSLNLYVFLQSLALAPLVVAGLRRAALGGARAVALAAVALAAGVSTLAVEFVAQAVALGVALGWAARPPAAAPLRMAAATGLGGLLAAVPIAVMVGFVPDTVRGAGFAPEVALGNELHPAALLQVLVADLFGPLSSPAELWWGGRFFTKGFPYFLSLHLGAVTLALAVAGWPGLDRRIRWALAACAVLGLWYALGARGGLAPLLSSVPLLRWFRFPSKALLMPHLAVAVFAAAGFDRLRAGLGWKTCRNALIALAALAALPALAILAGGDAVEGWARLPAWARGPTTAASAAAAAVALAGAGLAFAVQARRVTGSRGAWWLAALSAAGLVAAGWGMNPQVSPAFFDALPEIAALRLSKQGRVFSYGPDESPAFRRFLAEGPPAGALWSFFVNRQLLGPYTNMIDGVETSEAKDITALVPRPPALRPEDYDPRAVARILDHLRGASVVHVLSLDPLEHAALRAVAVAPSGVPGLHVRVYRLEGSWPRAYVACRAVAARDREEALALPLRAGFDPWRDVALEAGAAAEARAACAAGTVRRVRPAPAEEDYDVTLDGAGYLVMRETHARGWRARVDGAEAPVLRANGKHRAVALAGGRHRVRLEYTPPGLRAGTALSALAGLVTLGLLAGGRPGRRR